MFTFLYASDLCFGVASSKTNPTIRKPTNNKYVSASPTRHLSLQLAAQTPTTTGSLIAFKIAYPSVKYVFHWAFQCSLWATWQGFATAGTIQNEGILFNYAAEPKQGCSQTTIGKGRKQVLEASHQRASPNKLNFLIFSLIIHRLEILFIRLCLDYSRLTAANKQFSNMSTKTFWLSNRLNEKFRNGNDKDQRKYDSEYLSILYIW